MLAQMELDDARESLAYWQTRARRLPRWAVRRRREARACAVRWEARIAEAERTLYGRGLVGAVTLVLAEGRLPQSARRTGRHLARRTVQVAAVAFALATTMAVAGMVLVIELVSTLV